MKLHWQLFLVVAATLLKENLCVPAIRPLSQRGIIFPVENWDDCFLDDASTQPGVCKSLDECSDVLKQWEKEKIYPKTCYFIKKEQFVCCPMSVKTESTTVKEATTNNDLENDKITETVQRRSELECELHQTFEQTVVGGEPTKPNEFPFMATLGWTSNFDNTIWYQCGGVLISAKFILTAAHCAEVGGEQPSVVHVGGSNLTDSKMHNVKIKQFIKHPGYNITSIYHDIALVELEKEVPNDMACLWTTFDLAKDNVIALGYGHTRFGGSISSQLLKAPLKAVTKSECAKYYEIDAYLTPMGITDSHLCAGDPEKLRDTCQGDSGGPLIMEIGKTSYVVGVTSFGLGCSGEPPSIYTRVSTYIDWIENIVWPNLDVRFNKD